MYLINNIIEILLPQLFHSPLDFVRDYPGEPASERQTQESKRTNLDLLEKEIVSGAVVRASDS